MDRREIRKEYWAKLQKQFLFLIILLLILLAVMIFRDRMYPEKIEKREYEGEVRTYEGSLHRNLSNPLGSE